jgi:hypothetical protein
VSCLCGGHRISSPNPPQGTRVGARTGRAQPPRADPPGAVRAGGTGTRGCRSRRARGERRASGDQPDPGGVHPHPGPGRGPLLDRQHARAVRPDGGAPRAAAAVVQLQVVALPGCTPVQGATVDIWHCAADGRYSGFPSASGAAEGATGGPGGPGGGPGGPPPGGGPGGGGSGGVVQIAGETFLCGMLPVDAQGAAEFATTSSIPARDGRPPPVSPRRRSSRTPWRGPKRWPRRRSCSDPPAATRCWNAGASVGC